MFVQPVTVTGGNGIDSNGIGGGYVSRKGQDARECI